MIMGEEKLDGDHLKYKSIDDFNELILNLRLKNLFYYGSMLT